MVSFNTPIPKTDDPSYLTLPKGVDKGLANPSTMERPATPVMPAMPAAPAVPNMNVVNPVNNTYASIFDNLARGVEVGAQGAYGAITNRIQTEMRDTYRGLQENEFGVGPATEVAGARVPPTNARGDSDPISILAGGGGQGEGAPALTRPSRQGKGLPPGAQGIISKMANTQGLYESGQLSNSYYLGVMNAAQTQFLMNYPGFEKEIEAFSKELLGVQPPNALRASLMADYDMAHRSAGAARSDEYKEVVGYNKEGYLPPTMMRDWAEGKPGADIWNIRKIVGERQSRMRRFEAEKAERTNDVESKEVQTTRSFSNQARDTVTFLMNNDTFSPEAKAVIERWRGGEKISPEEQKMVGLTIINKMKEVDTALSALERGIDPFNGRSSLDANGGSPTTYLKPEQISAIKEQAKGPLKIFANLIGRGDWSLGGQFAELMKSTESQQMYEFQQKFPNLHNWAIMSKGINPAILGAVLGSLPGQRDILPGLVGDMQKWMKIDTLSQANPPAQADQLDKAMTAIQDPTSRAKLIRADIAQNSAILSGNGANADPEVIKGTAKSTYHSNNDLFRLVNPQDYINIYNQYTTPGITTEMKKQGQSDPAIFNNYQTWATNNFTTALAPSIRELQSSLKYIGEGRFRVEYNSDTHLFEYDVKKLNNFPAGNNIKNLVDQINVSLFSYTHILKEGNRDINGTVQNLFDSMGVKFGVKTRQSKEEDVINSGVTFGNPQGGRP